MEEAGSMRSGLEGVAAILLGSVEALKWMERPVEDEALERH